MTNEQGRRQALADFLKAHRARISPRDAGLPAGSRRRTPGLRREEVAQLAGVGVTWYTWLEQGRAINASEQVLNSIAAALQLDADEKQHLFMLALPRQTDHKPLILEKITPPMQQVIDALCPNPAYIIGRRCDVLAWNQAAGVLFRDFCTAGGDRNILRFMFINPLARSLFANWEGFARYLLALFRGNCDQNAGDSTFDELVAELADSSLEFREWWPHHDVRKTVEGRELLNLPHAGTLRLERSTFQPENAPGLRILTYTADPESESAYKLRQIATSVSHI
jgi:transcriptional regulator with XRE-family HTH domain